MIQTNAYIQAAYTEADFEDIGAAVKSTLASHSGADTNSTRWNKQSRAAKNAEMLTRQKQTAQFNAILAGVEV